jgi:hypothetical protein
MLFVATSPRSSPGASGAVLRAFARVSNSDLDVSRSVAVGNPKWTFVKLVCRFKIMTRAKVLDLYFMEARAKLIDIAAFLDRMDRASGPADFRFDALRTALEELSKEQPDRARQVLLSLSDPTPDPIEQATTKAACGAWPGNQN